MDTKMEMNNVLVVEENKSNYLMGLVLLILSLDGEDKTDVFSCFTTAWNILTSTLVWLSLKHFGINVSPDIWEMK